jgi:hypothetical protein
MFQVLKAGIACAVIAVSSAALVEAQRPVDPPLAPVPEQLLSAKKVFISNTTGKSVSPEGVSDLTYNEFYADMKSWGAYELVSSPANADLILEIRYEMVFGAVNVVNGMGGSGQFEAFQLVIRDPKTRTVLWAFTRAIQGANRQATGRKNFDSALSQMVDDLKKLVAPPTVHP